MLPVIEQFLKFEEEEEIQEGVFCLIITPTRELAIQIYEVIAQLQKTFTTLGVKCCYGGKNKAEISIGDEQHIVVATPGRLNDIMSETTDPGASKFRNLQYLILDEADRLLDSNF